MTCRGSRRAKRISIKKLITLADKARRDLFCLIYRMFSKGEEYVKQGIDAYEQQHLNRKFALLNRLARKLGLQLVPTSKSDEQRVSAA